MNRGYVDEERQLALFKIEDLLEQLTKDDFYGEVTITFQNGKPHTIKVHRTYKLDQL